MVGLDICHGKYAKFLKEKSIFTNQTVVHHDSSGRNYVVNFVLIRTFVIAQSTFINQTGSSQQFWTYRRMAAENGFAPPP